MVQGDLVGALYLEEAWDLYHEVEEDHLLAYKHNTTIQHQFIFKQIYVLLMLKANSRDFLTSKKLFMMTLIVLSLKLFPVQSLQHEITFK